MKVSILSRINANNKRRFKIKIDMRRYRVNVRDNASPTTRKTEEFTNLEVST